MAGKQSLTEYEVELERIRQQLKSLHRKDRRHGKINYSSLDTDELSGEEMIPDADSSSVEDIAILNIMCEKLRIALLLLPATERELLQRLYFENLSERQLSKQTGIHYMTIHNRKVKALEKLRKKLSQ